VRRYVTFVLNAKSIQDKTVYNEEEFLRDFSENRKNHVTTDDRKKASFSFLGGKIKGLRQSRDRQRTGDLQAQKEKNYGTVELRRRDEAN
jgi:hypothetical protein